MIPLKSLLAGTVFAVLFTMSNGVACDTTNPQSTELALIKIKAPELEYHFLPTTPIPCLLTPSCELRTAGSFLERSRRPTVALESAVDPSSTMPQDFLVESLRPGIDVTFDDVAAAIEAAFANGLERAQKARDQTSADFQAGQQVLVRSPKPQISPRPKEFLAEMNAYSKSTEYFDCSASLYAMEYARGHELAERTKQVKVLVALYARYTAYCFKQAEREIVDRLAMFYTTWPPRGAYGFYCLGFDLDGKHIVTAKHCVVDPGELEKVKNASDGKVAKSRLRPWKMPESTIVFASEPHHSYEYEVSRRFNSAEATFFSPIHPEDDIAIVELRSPRTRPTFAVSPAREWDRIRVVTSFLDIRAISACTGDPQKCALAELIREDDTPNCAVIKVKNQCILHACQSRPGASGGPIIAKRGERFILVGVHTGSIDQPRNAPCQLPRGEVFRNYGLTVDSSIYLKGLVGLR